MIDFNEAERQRIRTIIAATSWGLWKTQNESHGKVDISNEIGERIFNDISVQDASLIVDAREWITGLLDKVESLTLQNDELHGKIQLWYEHAQRVQQENAELKAELGQPTPPTGLEPLNEKQSEAYKFISDFSRRKHYSPSTLEIRDALGYSSLSTAHHVIKMLERKGYIIRNGRRSISLVSREKKKGD
ncbi:LexA family protein [Paenibacillus sp. Leaf72]|uniref:LexA family protein n=1 Tax=Paenibacillus sp. Leaf72 TaxID=1736234 RepID=UPI0006FE9C98|nr:hypothetical protein [Paenibacillus sp. Leaf72]KQN96942.1 hypothetical protein ASF12_23010 [Paenibacillus sp. Leaf72]